MRSGDRGLMPSPPRRTSSASSREVISQEALLEAVADRLQARHADAGPHEARVHLRRGLAARPQSTTRRPSSRAARLAHELAALRACRAPARRRRRRRSARGARRRRRRRARRSDPASTTLPRSTIAAASQIFSTSSSRCEEMNTVRPSCSTIARIISRNSWMPPGSRPLVGSSRISSSGSASRQRATPRRWRMPIE